MWLSYLTLVSYISAMSSGTHLVLTRLCSNIPLALHPRAAYAGPPLTSSPT